MFGVPNAIHDGIAHIQIWGRHIDLGSQHARPVRKFTLFHALEQIEIFVNRAIPERDVLAAIRQRAASDADLIRRQVIDVGVTILDEALGPFV